MVVEAGPSQNPGYRRRCGMAMARLKWKAHGSYKYILRFVLHSPDVPSSARALRRRHGWTDHRWTIMVSTALQQTMNFNSFEANTHQKIFIMLGGKGEFLFLEANFLLLRPSIFLPKFFLLKWFVKNSQNIKIHKKNNKR